MVAPQEKRACSKMFVKEHGVSERQACRLVGANRTTVRYYTRRASEEELKRRIREIAMKHRRYGYRRVHILLRREGKKVNHKRVYRLYKNLGLKVLKRGGRKRAVGARKATHVVNAPNQCWALDFVHDRLANGRRLRLLTVLDTFSKESLKIVVDYSLNGLCCKSPGRPLLLDKT